jgi:hypothetical protein
VPAFPAAAVAACLTLSGCSTPEADPEPSSGLPDDYVSVQWIEREARIHTLDRMFEEQDSAQVVANTGGTSDDLLDGGILVEAGGEYAVQLDKDAWDDDLHLARTDGALGNAMYHNEVTWCGGTVTGEEFVDAYMDEYGGSFETHEEYTASVVDYVGCGTGAP